MKGETDSQLLGPHCSHPLPGILRVRSAHTGLGNPVSQSSRLAPGSHSVMLCEAWLCPPAKSHDDACSIFRRRNLEWVPRASIFRERLEALLNTLQCTGCPCPGLALLTLRIPGRELTGATQTPPRKSATHGSGENSKFHPLSTGLRVWDTRGRMTWSLHSKWQHQPRRISTCKMLCPQFRRKA